MYDMTVMNQIAKAAINQMPPNTRFTDEDGKIIQQHKDLLMSIGGELVTAFYDTLFAHEPTRVVFRKGERAEREVTLAAFWAKTLNEPINDDYFGWMAMVGLIHVVRGVENPMMLAMSSFLTDFVEAKAEGVDMDAETKVKLIDAFRRFSSTISAIITYGYDSARVTALYDIAGMPESLLQRLTKQTVEGHLNKAGYVMTEKRVKRREGVLS